MDERYAAERPLVIDSPAPPIAHPHTQMFAEAMRRHDLIIDDKELRLLLLGFQPLLHSSDGEGPITPLASEGVSCFRPLSNLAERRVGTEGVRTFRSRCWR